MIAYSPGMQTFSPKTISALRSRLGLSQAQFAQLFVVHVMTANRWEKGNLVPTDYQLALMAEFKKAADRKSAEFQESLGTLLVGAGAVAVLLLLLSAAKGK